MPRLSAGLDPISRISGKVPPTYDDQLSSRPWSDAGFGKSIYHPIRRSESRSFKAGITKECQHLTPTTPAPASQRLPAAARLVVMTRSFERDHYDYLLCQYDRSSQTVSLEEFEFCCRDGRGRFDAGRGSHAMVPILDLYNHHGKPNVGLQR
jgi:hypothetical protein